MKYPEERLLIVRPCLKAICYRDKPASKLLSLLLYYARNCDEQETEFTFTSRQDDIITDLLDEMDVKTLHRTAIPMLRLLGYIDVDGSSYRYTYTVHIGYIQKMLNFYATNKQQLDKCLIDIMRKQLEIYPEQLDIFLKQLDKSRIQLDKCLIPFRQMSNSKRGRKPRSQATAETHFEDPQITIDNIDNIDSCEAAVAPHPNTLFENDNHSQLSPKTDELSTSYPIAKTTRKPTTSSQKATRKQPTKEEKPPTPELSPEEIVLKERCSSWYQRICDHCNGPMRKGGEVINERNSLRELCGKYNDTQIEAIFSYLVKRHWKWSKPDNKYKVRAYIILDEAPSVANILRDERIAKEQPTNTNSALDQAIGATRNLDKEMAEMEARYSRKRAQSC